jgi:hypothetical protein
MVNEGPASENLHRCGRSCASKKHAKLHNAVVTGHILKHDAIIVVRVNSKVKARSEAGRSFARAERWR